LVFIIGNVLSTEYYTDGLANQQNFDYITNNQLDDYTDAYLFINSSSYKKLILAIRNIECVNCKYIDFANISFGRNISIRLSTLYPTYNFIVRKIDTNEIYCHLKDAVTFGEKSIHQLIIDNNTGCTVHVITESGFVYWPVITAILSLIGLTVAFIILKILSRKVCKAHYVRVTQTSTECDITITETNNESFINNDELNIYKTVCCTQINTTSQLLKENQKQSNQRLKFIDTFRGICLCAMIFVNYGGGGYTILGHAVWNGLNASDLLFPSFIFIMGTSIALSIHNIVHKEQQQNAEPGSFNKKLIKNLLIKIIRRSLLLFFFGLLTSNNSTVSFQEIRIMGILQRFSISYFICALLELVYLMINNFTYHEVSCFDVEYMRPLKFLRHHFKEVILYQVQWLVILIFTLVWVLVTFLLPVPGCPTGYLGPGGLHDNGTHENCTGGAAGYIDRVILGQSHLYQWSMYRSLYQAKLAFDSEGLLGCLTSCLLAYLGVSAGHIIIHYKESSKRVLRFSVYGVIYGGIAMLLCKARRDDGWVPVNKSLWSLSFVLAIASICFFSYTVLYLMIDKWRLYSGKPFIFPGKNSICIYICHIVFSNFFPIQFHVANTHAYLTALHLYGVVLWCFVAWIMDLKKVLIKI
jgi:heparan-alpha-glucosaminide N-acetyltransferase